ncbi:hypothetical protein MRB53_017420 [Persea americana]|uniref:Uncharacterized protein n=1 Tax=Persea americana TaxID=3435 RepID=A0ACC2M511_PERAE|nr:hypothetical protein MRB53_017420 [Persea americana]
MEAAEARAAGWVAEREDLQAERERLQKALEAKDELLREEVSNNAGLAVDLKQTQAEVARLREGAAEEAAQNAHLSADLDRARAALVGMEKDLLSSRGLSKRLLAKRNEARGQLEVALREKAAELESALARQKTELKEKYVTELKAITKEEVQLPGIRDRGWELGWKAALRKAGVPGDNPMLRNPPKFPSSDSDLHAIITSPPVRAPEALQAPPEAAPDASVPEASAVVFEATSAAPEASAVVIEAPPEIDCNVEAATL